MAGRGARMNRKTIPRLMAWVNRLTRGLDGLCVAFIALALMGCGPSEPATNGGPATVRLLTEAQYRNIIADVFGSSITILGRFDAPQRENGLLAVGASKMDITPSALERYDSLARSIAAQVMDEKRRHILVSCKPVSAAAFDESCAREFISSAGRFLYRRPLQEDELQLEVNVASTVATARKDFYAGLEYALSGMLVTPAFLYIADITEPDPSQPGTWRLNGYSKASRLSFLLWNTSPDDELLASAERGELHNTDGRKRQVDRLLNSPNLEFGVKNFFFDMLGFDAVAGLAKDSIIYPAFNSAVAGDLQEQTLHTITELLLRRHEDYRNLFTTPLTFMSRALGQLYRTPVKTALRWSPYEFGEGDPRAGIQTQISFLALYSHPGKSSPTLRGKAIREVLLCQKVPAPPGDVNFDAFNDPISAKTVRERLTAHSKNPSCAGCHKMTDPIGLTLENYDGLGQFRSTENEMPINASGELDGTAFDGAKGLASALYQNPALPSCLVNRMFSYATARAANTYEMEFLKYLEQKFASDGYKIPELLRRISESDAFYAVSKPATSPQAQQSESQSTPLKGGQKS